MIILRSVEKRTLFEIDVRIIDLGGILNGYSADNERFACRVAQRLDESKVGG